MLQVDLALIAFVDAGRHLSLQARWFPEVEIPPDSSEAVEWVYVAPVIGLSSREITTDK